MEPGALSAGPATILVLLTAPPATASLRGHRRSPAPRPPGGDRRLPRVPVGGLAPGDPPASSRRCWTGSFVRARPGSPRPPARNRSRARRRRPRRNPWPAGSGPRRRALEGPTVGSSVGQRSAHNARSQFESVPLPASPIGPAASRRADRVSRPDGRRQGCRVARRNRGRRLRTRRRGVTRRPVERQVPAQRHRELVLVGGLGGAAYTSSSRRRPTVVAYSQFLSEVQKATSRRPAADLRLTVRARRQGYWSWCPASASPTSTVRPDGGPGRRGRAEPITFPAGGVARPASG